MSVKRAARTASAAPYVAGAVLVAAACVSVHLVRALASQGDNGNAGGGWTSVQCDGAAAPENGELGLWADGYYVAHDWSRPGRAILRMGPGDDVCVDGRRLRVLGTFRISRKATYGEVREKARACAGTGDVVMFQSCIDGTDDNLVAYSVCEDR